jgi:hypothetical protein
MLQAVILELQAAIIELQGVPIVLQGVIELQAVILCYRES